TVYFWAASFLAVTVGAATVAGTRTFVDPSLRGVAKRCEGLRGTKQSKAKQPGSADRHCEERSSPEMYGLFPDNA
ncbi:MAG: hypothetical protein LBL42_05000, partial [Tannerella sp.]|nr:hypothetical protein [Tannerella sp.]